MKRFIIFFLTLTLVSCISAKGIPIKSVKNKTYSNKVENQIDHSAWDTLLKKHVTTEGLVDYKGFLASKSELQNYVDFLAKQQPNNSWSIQEQLAYFINVYNANTIKLIVDNYPVKSIKDVGATISPFLKPFINIGEKEFSLADIERGILQKMNEPRIHFAINCASYSCPKLLRDAYTAENVNDLMDRAAGEFINSEKNQLSENNPKLSEIFKWYKKDFLQHSETIVDYINQYAEVKIYKDADIGYVEYNWNLNDVE